MIVGRYERCGPPAETKHKYSRTDKLIFFPSGHMLWGEPGCAQPASIMGPSEEEKRQYLCGKQFL
jgi:hypothetical protein